MFPFAVCLVLAAASPAQDAGVKKPDNFFAGTVLESTAQKITISRVVLGKIEKRSFRVTPDTKVKGKLHAKAQVTVRYITGEDGDVATLVVVRGAQSAKPK